jgi:hypothetical protein
MFIQGKQGSLNLYYKDLYIASYPLGKMNLKDYQEVANDLIVTSMRKQKRNIREQIFAYKLFCQSMLTKRIKKKKMSLDDHRMFLGCLLALVKLKIYEPDDVMLICKRKKKNKKITS